MSAATTRHALYGMRRGSDFSLAVKYTSKSGDNDAEGRGMDECMNGEAGGTKLPLGRGGKLQWRATAQQ